MSDSPLPSSFDGDSDFYNENRIRKFFKRFRDEPLVPLGVGLTCWAFYNASKSVRSGNSITTNRFFRYRLYAQGFTIAAMIGGSLYYKADRLKRTEYVKLKEKQRAQEKREKWIKELEARDKEDKEWREKLGKVQDLQREEEERRLVAEAKQNKTKTSDDRRGVISEIRQASNAAKANKPESKVPVAVVTDTVAEPKEESAKYESVMGEREEGGFMGYKHIQGFYKYRVKPFVEDLTTRKGNEAEGAKDSTEEKK